MKAVHRSDLFAAARRGSFAASAVWAAVVAPLLAAAGAVRAPAAEPGRYRLVLARGESIPVKLVAEDARAYTVEIEGSVVQVAREDVLRFEPAEPDREARGSAALPEAKPAEKPAADVEPLRACHRGTRRRRWAVPAGGVQGARRPSRDSRPFLHRALRHRDHRVRLHAVKILGEYGTEKDDLEAVSALLVDPHAYVRRNSIVALRRIGPRGLPALVRSLPQEAEAANRKVAIGTLRGWNDARAIVPLVDLLARETDEAVKLVAASALEALTGEKLGTEAPAWWAYLAEADRLREAKKMVGSGTGKAVRTAKEKR